MTTETMRMLTEAARAMDDKTLRAAARECLDWQQQGTPPEEGTLQALAAIAPDSELTSMNRLERSGAAVLTEVARRYARVTDRLMQGSLSRMDTFNGDMVGRSASVEAIVTYRAETGIAYATGIDGEIFATLSDVKVEWIRSGSIGFSGMENRPGSLPQRQAWYYTPPGV